MISPVSLRSFDRGSTRGRLAHLFDDTGAIVPLERLREEAIRHALKVTGGNILHAARQLGVGRATFYRLMKRYGIPVDR
ncbi:MAG: helix-turn-helix domain-containing protein [Ignavibacteriae bacterium]|nr:helix-turn-helix domain-containing protein [Ignavibacteriota bacterium]